MFPQPNYRCESYQSNIDGLCSAKPTRELCERMGDIDQNISGNECEWAEDKICDMKQDIDWSQSEYCG